ncbi:MAG TPA: autotransporter domain-containing protein [Xanthobacteraceae bacterium]|jgi:outer membrane autotransporter protein|nr:autotransporter domain-containing protein [Xanthobacteraceae bacterium]
MLSRQRARRNRLRASTSLYRIPVASVAAVGLSCLISAAAQAGQLPISAFQTYIPGSASSIVAGPFALYAVPLNLIQPAQINVGLAEVAKKTTGWDILPSNAAVTSALLADIEPVVIGPGGVLYLENGHHTFTSLSKSGFGASDPTVYIDVIANFSNLTTPQFWAAMEADNLVLPLNNGVAEAIDPTTGAPIPTSFSGLTNDPYRSLEFLILKNKSSKLFTTTSNITGAVGSAKPGLDKVGTDYSDFLWADAYRFAINPEGTSPGAVGLPFLSAADVALATKWNLSASSTTTMPNVGVISVAQLPGFILPSIIIVSSTISNATLANGTLDGTSTATPSFHGFSQLNLGTASEPILVGTPQSGFMMQLGNDLGGTVTLSGVNTYTGGTTFIAGTLIISGAGNVASDAALGAAATSFTFNPNNVVGSVEAADGIIFASLMEGNGTLQIGPTANPGNGATFSTNRPIAVGGEIANINLNGYQVTLSGQIVSVGIAGTGLSNQTGFSDITIEDTSTSGAKGALILPSVSNNANYFGNWIITSGTLNVSNDASLGSTNATLLNNEAIGQIELNGGTFQIGSVTPGLVNNFTSQRNVFLGSNGTFDTNGNTAVFSNTVANPLLGVLTDVQRTLTIANSNTSGTNAVGAVTFSSLAAGATATIALNAGASTSTTGGHGTTVTFTNGITRNGNTDIGAPPNATVFIDPATGSTLGLSGTNGVEMFSSGASATNNHGIAPVWIITDSGGSASSNPYNFVTYNAANGYTATTNYTGTFGASNVVQVSTSPTISTSQAYALNVENSKTLTINGGNTLTIGDGTNPAGLILEGTTLITGGTLAFGASEAVIDVKSTNTITSAVTGTGGLTLSGSGTLVLNGIAGGLSGPITVDSGTLQLGAANYFPTTGGGTTIWLSNVSSSPSAANLAVNASNVISALNSDGNNSTVTIATTDTLTIGDSNNLSSTLSSKITGTGSGSLVKAGTGLLDISGSGGVSFGSGASVTVNAGALRIGNGVFSTGATTPISVASGAELQYSGNGGSQFNDPITGGGVFHLVGGTVQLTGTTNSYSGGTVIEVGATLDVTTANLPNGTAVTNAGGTLLFDQSTTGTFTGIMSDGAQAGGPTDLNDMACIVAGVTCASTSTLSGTLIKDDSTHGNSGNVTLSVAQTYTGFTYIEAGTLTLGAVDTVKTSAGVVLGRVGGAVCNPTCTPGAATAILALGADNTIKGLMDVTGNITQVTLNGHTLTLAPGTGTSWSYAGAIVDGTSAGNLIQNGLGTSVLTGTSTYTGTTLVSAGTLDVEGTIANTSGVTVSSGATLVGGGTIDPPTTTIISGTFAPGTPGSPGTSMTVNGNLQFNAGSNYIVQLSPTATTFANVTGTAALAGNVLAAFQAGSYMSKQTYTILESAGLNNTKFTSLATTNSNFAATLSYTPNNVLLTLGAALGSGSGANGNQQNVANSINNFFNGGGTLTPNFASIFAMSGGNLNQALSQLSGETATAAQTASFSMMTSFLGIMTDPSVDGRSGSGGASGFAPEREAEFPPDIALAYASVMHKKQQPQPAVFEQRWTAWGSGFGGYNKTEGDPAAGTNTVTARAYGFAGGLDYHFTADIVAGFALAGSGSNWSTAQNLGTGRSDSFQFGLYGTSRSGPAYLSASVGLSEHWITTNRIAPLGDQLTARFDAQSYGARLEAGYRYGMMPVGVTPYAAVQTQLFHTPNYRENDLTGAGFALSFASQSATDTRSELGARFDNAQIFNGMPLMLRARVAWAHDWASDPTLSAAFQTLPGGNFIVNGAGVPSDSALTSAGAELKLNQSWSVLANFDGEFAKSSQTYSGTGTIRYVW